MMAIKLPIDKRSELEQEYGQDHPWPQFDKWHKEFHEFAAGGPIAWPCAKPLRCFWRWTRKSGVTVNQNGIVTSVPMSDGLPDNPDHYGLERGQKI
jgi:hypothetical protein